MINNAKTKIIATIGPSCWEDSVISQMIEAGMDLARINASFADEAELERVSTQIRRLSPRVGIILDTKGNKIRVTGFEKPREIKDKVILSSEKSKDSKVIQVGYPNLHEVLVVGARILIDDGNIQVEVSKIEGKNIHCKVIQGGILKKNKTVNIPAIALSFPPLSDKDKSDILYAAKHSENFDFISMSFTRNKEDLLVVKEMIKGTNLKLIAKIECEEGVRNFDDILTVADAVMVARGDMGNEMDLEAVPVIQKQLIRKCREKGVPVIVATQMLESMTSNIRPTRAEVSDVANAVMDGADCVMLSAETSTGSYPVQAISMMNKVALQAESASVPAKIEGTVSPIVGVDDLASCACEIADKGHAKAILISSDESTTVGSVSRHMPNVPIYVVSTNIDTIRQNSIYRGVKTFYIENLSKDRDFTISDAIERIYSYGELDLGDTIAVLSGSSIRDKRGDTILELVRIKDFIN
ncbi:pyruvate kinase [bacterium]|nr:pyruvate kinase [bacterium]